MSKILEAVNAAGGCIEVAHKFGYATTQTVYLWARKRSMPVKKISPLCEMGGNKVTPAEILQEISGMKTGGH